jgi:hypothetical protein
MLKKIKSKRAKVLVAIFAITLFVLLIGGLNAYADGGTWSFIFPPDGNFWNLTS